MSKELLVKLNEVVSYLERSGANPTQIVLALTVRDAIGELRQAEAELERAGIVLRDNMALANSQAREHRTERDSIIKELRKRYSAIEIADMAGLTRQRVHQILKEPPIPIMKPDRLALIEENEQLRAEAIAAEADLSDERAKNEMAEHKLVVEREALKADLVKARDTALEDAAKVCNDIIYVPHGDGSYTGMFRHFGNQQCAAAIRAMKGK